MSEHKSGPREGVEGVVEDVKGKTKEAAGIVTGDEDLKGEGHGAEDADQQQGPTDGPALVRGQAFRQEQAEAGAKGGARARDHGQFR